MIEIFIRGHFDREFGGVTPTGTATISDGAATLATVPLVAGVATLNSSALTAGVHTIKAVYNGDSNYQ